MEGAALRASPHAPRSRELRASGRYAQLSPPCHVKHDQTRPLSAAVARAWHDGRNDLRAKPHVPKAKGALTSPVGMNPLEDLQSASLRNTHRCLRLAQELGLTPQQLTQRVCSPRCSDAIRTAPTGTSSERDQRGKCCEPATMHAGCPLQEPWPWQVIAPPARSARMRRACSHAARSHRPHHSRDRSARAAVAAFRRGGAVDRPGGGRRS